MTNSMVWNTTELRFAPAIRAMWDFLRPNGEWIGSVLGCGLSETITFQLELDLGHLAVEALLPDGVVEGNANSQGQRIKSGVLRTEFPPGACPRLKLAASRKRGVPLTSRQFAWYGEWRECPFAVWLKDVPGPFVVANVPYIAFQSGLAAEWQNWLLVNRSSATAVLNRLAELIQDSSKSLITFGQSSTELGNGGYDWNSLVLDPAVNGLIRQDFESFFQREEWFRRHHLPFKRGYLLYGPPGNGKTSVIRVMASHPAVTPLSFDFSNESCDNFSLDSFFVLAHHSAPSLIIFEDLDRIFAPNAKPDDRIKISFQHLLNCLDGVAMQEGIIVVATANNPATLGPAMVRRPGRFDRVVAFPPPNAPMRVAYFSRMAASLDSQALETVAAEAEGFSFAQLRESYILAGQSAFQRDEDVSLPDLMEAIRTMRGEGWEIAHAGGPSAGFRAAESVRGSSIG